MREWAGPVPSQRRLQSRLDRLGEREPGRQQGQLFRRRLDPVPHAVRQPLARDSHRDDPVGHDQERQACDRLPHELQPKRAQRQPLPRGHRVQLCDRQSIRDSDRSAGRGRRRYPDRRQLHALRRNHYRCQLLLLSRRDRLCRRQVSADHAHLHRQRREPGARLGRPHRLPCGLGPYQLCGVNPRLAVPHAPDRSRRRRRQPGPFALGGRGHLPRIHPHREKHDRWEWHVRLHGEPAPAGRLQHHDGGRHRPPGLQRHHELHDLHREREHASVPLGVRQLDLWGGKPERR